jgi:hypothetical protein
LGASCCLETICCAPPNTLCCGETCCNPEAEFCCGVNNNECCSL